MNVRKYPQVTGTLAAATETYCWPFENSTVATNVYADVRNKRVISFACTNTGGANAITASLIEGCWAEPDSAGAITDESWVALATDTLTPAIDTTEIDEIDLYEHGCPLLLRVTLTSATGTTFALDANAKD